MNVLTAAYAPFLLQSSFTIITDLEEICWDATFHNQLKNIIKITILKTFCKF